HTRLQGDWSSDVCSSDLAVYYPVVEILSAIAIASVIWFGGRRALVDAALLGTVVAFIQYAQRFFRPIQDLSEKYNILQSAMASRSEERRVGKECMSWRA